MSESLNILYILFNCLTKLERLVHNNMIYLTILEILQIYFSTFNNMFWHPSNKIVALQISKVFFLRMYMHNYCYR